MESCPVCQSKSIRRPKLMPFERKICSNCQSELSLTFASPKATITIVATYFVLQILLSALEVNRYIVPIIQLFVIYCMTLSPRFFKYVTTNELKESIAKSQSYETQIKRDNLREWLPFTLVVILVVIALVIPIF